MANLFTGLQDAYRRYSDPCIPPAGDPLPAGCAQLGVQDDSQVLARVGGNPNLQPEHGDTLTAGLVWTPQFGDHGLTVTVDYWDIYLEDAIDELGVQFTLNQCYIELSQPACALITRNPDYSVAQVIDTFLNVGVSDPQGVDTEIRWSYSSGFGLLQASLLWTHTLESKQKAFEGDEVSDNVGTARAPQDKVNLSLQWMLNDWSVSYFGEYISAVTSETFYDPSYLQQISSFWYHDLTASYTFGGLGGSTQLSAGIRNITNEAPPFIETGVVTTDVSTYRLFGRGYYLNLKWKF
jgi:outer membrane receptor protein involved in Fe transport